VARSHGGTEGLGSTEPEDRFPAPHGYAATREEAMQAFASVWYG
jgi:hypothetical protein